MLEIFRPPLGLFKDCSLILQVLQMITVSDRCNGTRHNANVHGYDI